MAKEITAIAHDLLPAADEISVKIEGGIRSAKLKIGGFRRTHPSRLETIETPKQRADQRASLVQSIADAKAALSYHDDDDEDA